jgi:6-phosphofructokinase 1
MPAPCFLIAQGGGPTAVINQSLAGAVLQARALAPGCRFLGARHGVKGLVAGDLVDLGDVPAAVLDAVAATPAAALGSTRDKPDAAYCRRILERLREHGVSHFLQIGGNDSSDTLRLVSEAAADAGHALAAVHVPKTIDNDLVGSHHTPGWPSAARFVAQAFAGADLDNASLPGVYVGVVMGRHAGFLTAASTLLREDEAAGPHLVCVPERPFEMAAFLDAVAAALARHGRCVAAVSEGIAGADGVPIAASLAASTGAGGGAERDAHGNVQLSGSGALADLLCEAIKRGLGAQRVRGDTFGYLQRSFLGCVSDVDAAEARAAGAAAVRYALDGDGHGARRGSVAVQRDAAGALALPLLPLEAVAGRTRTMDAHHLDAGGFDVTPAFAADFRPLLGSGLPRAVRLAAPGVPRVPRVTSPPASGANA